MGRGRPRTAKVVHMPTDWQLLKFEYDDRTGRVYQVEQRKLRDGTTEHRRTKVR